MATAKSLEFTFNVSYTLPPVSSNDDSRVRITPQ